MTGQALVSLPEKHRIDHTEELSEDEMKVLLLLLLLLLLLTFLGQVFSRVKEFSKAAVDKFMAKREEKEMLAGGGGGFSYKAR